MAKKKTPTLDDEAEFIVNFDAETIHASPVASESCNSEDAAHRSGIQVKSEEYASYEFCEICF